MKYREFILFKGDLLQVGAVYRMCEMRAIFKAFAELLGGEYQEDRGSYALMVQEDRLKPADVAQFKKDVLAYVDLCGDFTDAEVDAKAKKIVELANKNACPIGAEVIQTRVENLLMTNLYTERTWELGKRKA